MKKDDNQTIANNQESPGLKWLRENEDKLNSQHPGEWVALSANGVEAHAAAFHDFARLAREKMAATPAAERSEWLVHFVRGAFNQASGRKMCEILAAGPSVAEERAPDVRSRGGRVWSPAVTEGKPFAPPESPRDTNKYKK